MQEILAAVKRGEVQGAGESIDQMIAGTTQPRLNQLELYKALAKAALARDNPNLAQHYLDHLLDGQ